MEDDPFNRRRTDHENIVVTIMDAEMLGRHLTHEEARTIAAQWDAGATSDLHSFVTTGRVGEGLEDEIEANFNEATDPDDQQALAYLDAYVKARNKSGLTDGVDNWSGLWLRAPLEYAEDEDNRCASCGSHLSEPHAMSCPLDPENGEGDL